MNNKRIFYYEFKRLIRSREYLLLLTAVFIYSLLLLRTTVIFGTRYTAPFSLWTFCDYLSSSAVLLFVMLTTLCGRQFSPSEQAAWRIIITAPMPVFRLKMIRFGAVICAFLIAAFLSLSVCFIFYRQVYNYLAFGRLIAAALILLLPSSVLIFGASMVLGAKKAFYVYALAGALLIIGVFRIPLPEYLDILGTSVARPLFAGAKADNFSFSGPFIAGRITFLAAGTAGVIFEAASGRGMKREEK